jgi:DNA-binding beta-propeller fold protein YncE
MNYNSLPIISSIVVVVVVTVTAMIFAQGNNNIVYSLLLPSKQFSANALQSSSSSSFSLAQTIAIPYVNGRIDHMAIDVRGQRLFVAELGNNSLDVINLKAAKRIQSISNNGLLNEPQSVLFIPELNRIFVSNGQDGTVDVFDAKSFRLIKKIRLPSNDADNMRYDPNSKLVYVGYGEGSLRIINATNYNIVGTISLNGHPESFQIEAEKQASGQKQRIFVNIPQSNSIEVVDSQKHTVSKTWAITNAKNNFPMALDEANHRLFVGTRDPPKLMVFDTNSGKVVSVLNIANDADDIFYDAARKRIYVSCGQGFINIFQQQDANHYSALAAVPTAQGARTYLFISELNRFYLAVPHIADQQSEIHVYQVG